jgi:hypothetical protein
VHGQRQRRVVDAHAADVHAVRQLPEEGRLLQAQGTCMVGRIAVSSAPLHALQGPGHTRSSSPVTHTHLLELGKLLLKSRCHGRLGLELVQQAGAVRLPDVAVLPPAVDVALEARRHFADALVHLHRRRHDLRKA